MMDTAHSRHERLSACLSSRDDVELAALVETGQAVCGVSVPADGVPTARNEYVRRCAAGRIPDDVPPAVAAILARHASAAARMNGFYWKLFDGDLSAEYPGQRDAGPAS